MKKTLSIDVELLARARQWSGAASDSETVRQALNALLSQIAAHRMIALIGSEPDAMDTLPPRRREMPGMPPPPSAKARRAAH